jgi:phosphonate transport system permease protein
MTAPVRAAAAPATWRRPPVVADARLRWGLILGFVAYLVLGIGSLEVNWERVALGLERGARFVTAFLQPDFVSRWSDIQRGFIESLTMTVTSTAVGVLLSIPVAVGAATNLAPRWIYLLCRSFIAVSRSINEIIVAILLVAMFGFGPFAGFLTLTFATIGFMAKLLAEDIEEIDTDQLDALRATGAGFLQRLDFGVLSQVMPRLVGLSMYRLDINFRESAVIGIVGAGGVGDTLNTAMDRYEYGSAAAVILIIIAIVLVSEYTSGLLRKRIQ